MYSEAQKNATINYLKKQKEIRLWVKEEEYKEYADAAKRAGVSLRQYVRDALAEKMAKEVEIESETKTTQT